MKNLRDIVLKILKSIFTISIVLTLNTAVYSQDFEIGIFGSQGLGYQLDNTNIFEPGFSGAGLNFAYSYKLSKNWASKSSLEYSIAGWGGQLLTGVGMDWIIIGSAKLNWMLGMMVSNGMSLTKPKTLYVAAFDLGTDVTYPISKKLKIKAGLGARYTVNPAYKKFGGIFSYIDLPIRIGLIF